MKSKLLKRQINKYLKEFTQEEIKNDLGAFLGAIEDAYDAYEDDKKLMDRSLDISSQELLDTNAEILKSAQEKEDILDDLLESVHRLEETKIHKRNTTTNLESKDLGEYLKKLVTQNISNHQKIIYKERRLRAIMNSIGEGMFVVNKAGKVIICNDTAKQILGVYSKDIIRKHYNKIHFIHPQNGRTYFDFIGQSMGKNSSISILDNINIKNKDKNIPLSVIVSPIQGDTKQTNVGCVVVFRNMTEFKKIDIMKDEFLSIASHELRTPMTVVNGYIAILLKEKLGPLTGEQRKYLDRSQHNVNYLINLVNDMLHVSKLESGKMEMSYSCFDVCELLEEIQESYIDLTQSKDISLKLSGKKLEVCCDRDKLQQVIVNILGNACKFTPPGGEIDIKLQKNNTRFFISTHDSGVGISKEDIKRLFQKFSQVDSHLERSVEGTGLGLIICKLIVEQLGGDIGVTSELGKGSNFYFEIPIKNDKLAS